MRLNYTFQPHFFENIDLNADELEFTHTAAGWPAWVKMYPETGQLLGFHSGATGTWTFTITGTDEFGLSADLVVTVTVDPETAPT